MDAVFTGLASGFATALDPLNLFLVLAGCFAGTLIGALPGIGPINGVAILLPIAYGLGLAPESAIILLAGIYYGAEYGGRISSILLNVPGDASAVMTTLDGNPMARNGNAGRALSLSAIASFIGGTFAAVDERLVVRTKIQCADLEEAFALLDADEVDAVIHDRPLLRYAIKGDRRGFRVLPGTIGRQDYAAVLPTGSRLREQINRHLLGLITEGTIRDLTEGHLQ